MREPSQVTELLQELTEGRSHAWDELMPIVYEQLRRIAHGRLRNERAGHTLSTTALVHEAYLKLVDIDRVEWQDRAHFFAMASRLMRRILIDYARARKREKRGGHAVKVPLEEALEVSLEQGDDLVALDDALSRLETVSERKCRVVEYRCFGGLSVTETASVLGTSPATVKRDWAYARAWLNRELGPATGGGGGGKSPTR